jgi:hypothetical protein
LDTQKAIYLQMPARISPKNLPQPVHCPESYARLVAQGWDTVQEAFCLKPFPAFIDQLTAWQAAAADIGDSLEGKFLIDLNGQQFAMAAVGAKGGFKFRIECDDFLIFIGSPKRDWTISVRYLSAGLWEHGLRALRSRVLDALQGHAAAKDDDIVRTSRADWCFDFYSPQFSDDYTRTLAGDVVAHSSVKRNDHMGFPETIDSWMLGNRGETLTIGKKSGVQIQIYNKTKEISDMSGKTWMFAIWVEGLEGEWPWDGPPTDVWRLEVRFSGNFLKDRNIRRPAQLDDNLPALVTEALLNRRLTVPNGDSHRERWPLHPLWERALREFSTDKILPIGRQVTGRREALYHNATGQIAGAMRAAAVLGFKDYSDQARDQVIKKALERLENDQEHHKKIIAAQARYVTVDEAN